MAENYFWCSENRRRVICHHERLGCMQVLLLGGLIIVSTSISSDCIWIYVHVYTALQCVCVHVCLCVNSGSVDCGQKLLGKLLGKKKTSKHRLLVCHQFKGLFSTKKLWGKKRDGQKKETDFKMCSKEKQTQGSLFFSLLFGFFLCSYRKEQNDCGVQLQVKGAETGYWIDLNTFTDFHGGHLTFEKGGWGLR